MAHQQQQPRPPLPTAIETDANLAVETDADLEERNWDFSYMSLPGATAMPGIASVSPIRGRRRTATAGEETAEDLQSHTATVEIPADNGEGLLEARPVNDDRVDLAAAQPVNAEEITQRAQSKQRKEGQCKRIGAALFVISILIIVVSTVFGTANNRADTQTDVGAINKTLAPTPSPTTSPTSSLLDIDDLPSTTVQAILDPNSPQQKAYIWVAQHPDFRQNMTNWRKKQLLALATFYHSFNHENGTKWPAYYRSMDYGTHECYWFTSVDNPRWIPTWSYEWYYSQWDYTRYFCNCGRLWMPGAAVRPSPWDSNCDAEDRFQHLMWYGEVLQGTLPEEISFLTSLLALGLSSQALSGTIPSQIGLMASLSTLDLSKNTITGTIPSSIGLLQSMLSLDLSGNQIESSIPNEIGFQTALSRFAISNNMITGRIPSTIGLTNLTEILAFSNNISNHLPTEIGLLTGLIRIEIMHNSLTGIPTEAGRLKVLQKLDAQGNFISSLPSEMGQLTSLEYLGLSDNSIKGTLPSEIGVLKQLIYLNLSQNQISGTIPFSMLHNASAFQIILQGNLLTGIETNIDPIEAESRLELLDLRSNLISSLPSEFFLLTSLLALYLDGNRISTLPSEISLMTNLDTCGVWSSNSYLPSQFLTFAGNMLTAIPSEIAQLTHLYNWRFENNSIAEFPKVQWERLQILKSINLSRNSLRQVPSEIGLLQNLYSLDLSSNLLIGSIPSEIGGLDEMPDGCINYSYRDGCGSETCWQIQAIDLHNNSLAGTIPSELGKLTGLTSLDLSDNQLTGTLPSELGIIQGTGRCCGFNVTINLSGNNFSGPIPLELCPRYCKQQEKQQQEKLYANNSNSNSSDSTTVSPWNKQQQQQERYANNSNSNSSGSATVSPWNNTDDDTYEVWDDDTYEVWLLEEEKWLLLIVDCFPKTQLNCSVCDCDNETLKSNETI